MSQYFNHKFITTKFFKPTRSMDLTFRFNEGNEYFDENILSELEEIFDWLTSHIEIQSVRISSSTNYFCRGVNFLRYVDDEDSQRKISSLLTRIRSLNRAMLYLPQIFLIDYGDGAEGAGFEFGIGADLRVASVHSKFSLAQGHKGSIPMAGGLSLLRTLIGNSFCRKWNIIPSIPKSDLEITGYISQFYQSSSEIDFLSRVLKTISPTARVQLKGCLLQGQLTELENEFNLESNYGQALLLMEDWKKGLSEDNNDFKSIIEVANLLSGKKDEIYQL